MISHWQAMTDFSNAVNGGSLAGAPAKDKIFRATAMCNALFMEVAELQDSFAWKIFRDPLRMEEPFVDRYNVMREIVDCLFFLHHIGEAFDITPADLNSVFNDIMANNRRRHIDQDFSEEEAPAEDLLETINQKLDQLLGAKK